jgi:hypothetical protein
VEPETAGIRPITMRGRSALLAAVVAALLTTGCGSSTAPATAPPATRSPAPSGAAVPSPPASPPGPASPSDRQPPPSGTQPAPTGRDPEQGRDLVGAPIVLTGTVAVRGGCVLLDVDGRWWALVGTPAAGLTDGHKVTVRGRPAPVPAGCAGTSALRVHAVT